MNCPSCDTLNRDDAKFCKKCGQPFHTAARVPEAAAVSQTPTAGQENIDALEDISNAPTQIISPQQMMAFHANRWQKDLEQEQPHTAAGAQTMTTADQASGAADIAAQHSESPPPVINPPDDNEPIPIPPPPPMIEVVAPDGSLARSISSLVP